MTPRTAGSALYTGFVGRHGWQRPTCGLCGPEPLAAPSQRALRKVLTAKEQEANIPQAIWHKGCSDEAQLKTLLEDHHRWTGSKRALGEMATKQSNEAKALAAPAKAKAKKAVAA